MRIKVIFNWVKYWFWGHDKSDTNIDTKLIKKNANDAVHSDFVWYTSLSQGDQQAVWTFWCITAHAQNAKESKKHHYPLT